MSRPTLYLTNLSTRRHHGPGRLLCAMVAPRWWERQDGLVGMATPTIGDLRQVQQTGDLSAYRTACEETWGRWFGSGMRLRAETWTHPRVSSKVVDGDTLFCACARPGSPKRKHPCHLEILVPFLVRAGWDVVIDGRRAGLGCVKCWRPSPQVDCAHPDHMGAVWTDTGEPYNPAAFGWPSSEVTHG